MGIQLSMKRKSFTISQFGVQTSYVTVLLEVDGCRRVTVEIAPFADKTHMALGLCCENDNNFVAMSCRKPTNFLNNLYMPRQKK